MGRKKDRNIGVDIGLLNKPITATVEVFRSRTDDVLIEQPLPRYLGNIGANPIVNLGEIENRGIEFELAYRPRATGDWQWNVSANLSFIRNEIIALGNLGIDPETGDPREYIQSGNTRSQCADQSENIMCCGQTGYFNHRKKLMITKRRLLMLNLAISLFEPRWWRIRWTTSMTGTGSLQAHPGPN